MNAQDWVVIIGAFMTPISVILLALIHSRKIDRVQATATETLVNTTAINHAVNGKDPRESTLSEDVITIRDKQEIDQPTVAARNGDALLPLMRQLVVTVETLQGRLDAVVKDAVVKDVSKPIRKGVK